MGLIASSFNSNLVPRISFQTDSMFDLLTGVYLPGKDDYYLNGGLSAHINLIAGPQGHFKSSLSASWLMRSLSLYPTTDAIVIDTENAISVDKSRVYHMAGEHYRDELQERVVWLAGDDITLDQVFNTIKELATQKEKLRKELEIETPFLNPVDGQPIRIMLPTYVFVDSFTVLRSIREKDMLNTAGNISDDSVNTTNIVDGGRKTMFTTYVLDVCRKYGIVLLETAHYDKAPSLSQYQPNPKQTIFAKQDWKLKSCGSNLKFLATIYGTVSASVLLDSTKKEPLYGDEHNQMFRAQSGVDFLLERCKGNAAGTCFTFVASQYEGLLNALTNYHYLRINDFFGLQGSKQKQQSYWQPDLSLTRNTFRELSDSSPELRRAIALTAELLFIQKNWYLAGTNEIFHFPPQKLFDALLSDRNKELKQEILQSRGYWTYQGTDQPYMSLIKVLQLLMPTEK